MKKYQVFCESGLSIYKYVVLVVVSSAMYYGDGRFRRSVFFVVVYVVAVLFCSCFPVGSGGMSVVAVVSFDPTPPPQFQLAKRLKGRNRR